MPHSLFAKQQPAQMDGKDFAAPPGAADRIVGGRRAVMRDGEILAPGGGEPVRFQETL